MYIYIYIKETLRAKLSVFFSYKSMEQVKCFKEEIINKNKVISKLFKVSKPIYCEH